MNQHYSKFMAKSSNKIITNERKIAPNWTDPLLTCEKLKDPKIWANGFNNFF